MKPNCVDQPLELVQAYRSAIADLISARELFNQAVEADSIDRAIQKLREAEYACCDAIKRLRAVHRKEGC
ncbi:MAG: hypothetical protein M0Z55_10575 [Peptococcaceae bacterium]|nr:hypothetical protein [Peptococcaceae bacterium]